MPLRTTFHVRETANVFEARLIISGVAFSMLVLSAGIFRIQKAAKTCPVHNRHAGLIATMIAWGLLVAGLGLFFLAWLIL